MNKFLKSALCVAGVAGAFGAADANAVSFTVVIDKIELVKDADNYPNTATTIYEPRSNIGEAATKTVDLFNATEKLGTTFTLAKPESGEYETVIISFSEIKAVSGSAEYDLLAQYKLSGMATDGSLGVMVLGADGTGSDVTDVDQVFTTAMAPIQSVIADGSNDITLPTLDLYLPESAVVTTGPSALGVTQMPRPVLIVSQASDSASRANVTVAFDADTAFTGETGWSTASSIVTVGLFDSSVPETPLVSTTVSNVTSVTAITQVEFIDVPHNVSVHPIAWIDSDADGKLDTDEAFTVANLTKATNLLAIVASDITSSATLTTVAIDFPARTISIAISMTNDTSSSYAVTSDDAASGIEVTTAAGLTLAGETLAGALDISLTISVYTDSAEAISTSYVVPAKISMQTAGNTLLAATEVFNVVLADTLIDFADYGNLSYDAVQAGLTVTGVPAFQSTTFAANNAGAAYLVRMTVTEAANSETAFMTISEAGTAGTNLQEVPAADDIVTILGAGDIDLGTAAAFD